MTPLQILAYAESIAPRVFLGAEEVSAAHQRDDAAGTYALRIRVTLRGVVFASRRVYAPETRDAYLAGAAAFYEHKVREMVDELPEWRS